MKFSDFIKYVSCNLKVYYDHSTYTIHPNSNRLGDYPLAYYGFLSDKHVLYIRPSFNGIYNYLSVHLG